VLARICLREMKDRVLKRKELSGWEKERYTFFKERGWEWKDWEEQRVEGRISFEDLEKKDWELQREENWMKIREGRFSK